MPGRFSPQLPVLPSFMFTTNITYYANLVTGVPLLKYTQYSREDTRLGSKYHENIWCSLSPTDISIMPPELCPYNLLCIDCPWHLVACIGVVWSIEELSRGVVVFYIFVRSLTFNFWVEYYRANLFQGLGSCFLHLQVWVSENLGQFGNNTGQAGRQLLGSTECHSTQQLHRT